MSFIAQYRITSERGERCSLGIEISEDTAAERARAKAAVLKSCNPKDKLELINVVPAPARKRL
jgi:hypothetical protein